MYFNRWTNLRMAKNKIRLIQMDGISPLQGEKVNSTPTKI